MLALNSIAFSVFSLLVNTFNSTGKHSYANVLNLANRTLFFAAIVISSAAKTNLVVSLSTASYVFVVITALTLLWFKGFRHVAVKLKSLIPSSLKIMKSGAPLLITNLLRLLVLNLDLVLVRIIGSQEQFAFYGLSVTVIKTVLILATSGKTVLFPALKNKSAQLYSHKKNWELPLVLLAVIGSILAYFVLPLIIERFIPHYSSSLEFIYILLAALPFLFIVISLQTTQLLAENKQLSLLKNTLITIVFGLILNLPGVLLKNLNLIAYASVTTYFLYYVINRVTIGHGMKIPHLIVSIISILFILALGMIISYAGLTPVIALVVVSAFYLIWLLRK